MKPVNDEWAKTGLLRVSARTEIAAPADHVWSLVADASAWTTWHASHSEFEVDNGGALALGAAFRCKEWVFNNEGRITAWEPDRLVAFSLTSSTFSPLFGRYAERIEITPSPEADRCSVTHSGRIALAPLGWVLAGYVVGQALGAMYFDFRSSTRNLARLASAL